MARTNNDTRGTGVGQRVDESEGLALSDRLHPDYRALLDQQASTMVLVVPPPLWQLPEYETAFRQIARQSCALVYGPRHPQATSDFSRLEPKRHRRPSGEPRHSRRTRGGY